MRRALITRGVMITTDIPTKQLIKFLDDENENRIIIHDLDDKHVLINSCYLEYVTKECERLHEANIFERK